ncbi:hypothetical protein FMN52_10090 [Marinobacter sp. BW6]|uniref:hypothetical protein n=1 Tax=Marinobacter sp. BW6 TaxID=2592624 RepID=UPI0011DEE57F|nr:hypothetical protein [Marinobacter sp. BW6]TYC56919.1 hypothetical protein FMN52_10090 [Marinobacter sp. BW6]
MANSRYFRELASSAFWVTVLPVLAACSDSSGPVVDVSDEIEPDSGYENVLPSLVTQVEHWSPTGVFLAAVDCGQCHTASAPGDTPAVLRAPDIQISANQPSPQGEDISPFSDWKSSVMANSFTDPYFRANMVHESETFPHLAGFIEDTCLTCHSPMARTHAHQTGAGLEAGFYRAEQAVDDSHAREGISCTVCHQITDSVMDGNAYPDGVHSGDYEIPAEGDPGAFTIHGPYQNPQGQAMQNQVGFRPAFSQHMSDSRQCATCHELYTPTIDTETDQPNGEDFPEQTPYTEWANSDFGPNGSNTRSCQQCHMAREEISEDFLTRLAVRPNGSVNANWPERQPYSPHVMLGGNTWLLETLELFREGLGRGDINEAGEFAATAELTREFLKTAASISISGQTFSSGELAFDLTIQNNSGHKLPTSFPARRIWVGTRIVDANGTVVFANGIPDETYRLPMDEVFASDACLAAKKPFGFDSSACYLPHVSEVTSEQDVPVYEAVLGSTTGEITHILLYAANYLKDNRIPPRGFHVASVPEDVRPVGLNGDSDFNADNAGQDTIRYRIPVSTAVALPLQVETTLYYQSIRPTFIDGLHGEHEWVDEFQTIARLNPPPAEVMAELSFQVE